MRSTACAFETAPKKVSDGRMGTHEGADDGKRMVNVRADSEYEYVVWGVKRCECCESPVGCR